MELLATIRYDVQQGQISNKDNISIIGLSQQDCENELRDIFKTEVCASNQPASTSTFVSYLSRLIPHLNVSKAVADYWRPLLHPILVSREGFPSGSTLLNDVIACSCTLMSKTPDLVQQVMNDYLDDRHRALEGKRIANSNSRTGIRSTAESTQGRRRNLDVALPSPYWETRTGHNLERLLIQWANTSPTPQEFFELVAEYSRKPEQRLCALTILLPYLNSRHDLYLRTMIDTSLFDLLISCAMYESHPGLLSTSLAALSYSLPAVANRLLDRLDRLVVILLRVLQWEADFDLIARRLPEILDASPASSLSEFPIKVDGIPIKLSSHTEAVASSSGWDAQRLQMNFSPTSITYLGTFGGRRKLDGAKRGTFGEVGDDYDKEELDDDSSSDKRRSVASSDIKLDDDVPHASQYIQKLLSSSTRDILRRRIDDYFTVLYGLYPCSLLKAIREWHERPYRVAESPSLDHYEPNPNPFATLQSEVADVDADSTGHIRERLTELIRAHRMHQNLFVHSEESERKSLVRFSDTDAANIAASCFELRAPIESTLNAGDQTSKNSTELALVGINTIHEIGSALRKALRDIPYHAASISSPASPIPIPRPTVASHPDGLRLHVLVLLSDLYMERALRSRSIQVQAQSNQKSILEEDEVEGLLNLYNHLQKQTDEIAELKRKELAQREENIMIRERARKHEERLRQQLKIAKEESRLAIAKEKEAAVKLSSCNLANASMHPNVLDAVQRIFELENEVASMSTEFHKLKESEAQVEANIRRLGAMKESDGPQPESVRQFNELNSRIHELETQAEDSEREMNTIKGLLSESISIQSSLTIKIHHLTKAIERRDQASDKHHKIMSKSMLAHKEQLKAAEDRYITIKGINAQMEARLVDLWNRGES